jgi:predicted ATPase
LKKKGFKEERVTKVGLDAIGTSTTLESNKSRHRRQAEEGLHVLAEALAAAHTSEERFYNAELHRLKGELLLEAGELIPYAACHVRYVEEAEACFQQALHIAHHQQAKSLELRAAMSLARLWQQQGKHAEARELLAPIYGWFTEGFDTADLQDAKILLEALA